MNTPRASRHTAAKSYPPEFRGNVLAVARAADRTLAAVAREFGIHETTWKDWLKRDQTHEPGSGSSDPATEAVRELTCEGKTRRVGVYLNDVEFRDAKAAYLADWANGGRCDRFAIWMRETLLAYAELSPEQRQAIGNVRTIPKGSKRATRTFDVGPDAIVRMREQIVADQSVQRWSSESGWMAEAIHYAVDRARARNGGSLPEHPKRLPNRLFR